MRLWTCFLPGRELRHRQAWRTLEGQIPELSGGIRRPPKYPWTERGTPALHAAFLGSRSLELRSPRMSSPRMKIARFFDFCPASFPKCQKEFYCWSIRTTANACAAELAATVETGAEYKRNSRHGARWHLHHLVTRGESTMTMPDEKTGSRASPDVTDRRRSEENLNAATKLLAAEGKFRNS